MSRIPSKAITTTTTARQRHLSSRAARFASLILLSLLTVGFIASRSSVSHAQEGGGAPANDNFADAQIIDAANGNISGSNVGATLEDSEPPAENFSPGGASIWYKWTAPATAKFSFDTFTTQAAVDDDGFVEDTQLAIYTGTSLNDLSELGSSEDEGGSDAGYQSRVVFNATQGNIYYISLDSYSGQGNAGNIALNWHQVQAVPHDDFADAQDVGNELQGSVSGLNNADATAETGEPQHSGSVSNSLWFKWTAPSDAAPDAVISFNTYGSGFDTVMGVYTGASVGELEEIASNDEGDDETNGESQVDFPINAGTTYYIAVDGYDGNTGNITLNWHPATPRVRPANDNFADGEDITGASGNVTRTTANATREPGEPYHTAIGQDPDNSFVDVHQFTIWFDYTPTTSGTVAFDTLHTVCAGGSNCQVTQLAVYTGTSVDALTEVASNDDADTDFNNGAYTAGSRVYFNAVAGTTYRIVLAAKNEIDYTLTWQPFTIPVPANDNFANARMINVPASFEATNKYASAETNEPAHAGEPAYSSVWFRYNAATNGGVFFKADSAIVNNRAFSPRVAVYTGNSLGALTPVASKAANAGPGFNGAATVGFQAVAGTIYFIAVDGQRVGQFGQTYSNSAGRFNVTFNTDTTAPTSTIQTSPTPNANGFVKSASVSVSIQATDNANGSGVREIKYTLKTNGVNGAQQTVAGSGAFFSVSTEGETVVTYFAVDNAGNIESPAKTLTLKIDRTKPVTNTTLNGTAGNNNYYRSNATVNLSATDSYSGVASITYNVNGGAATTVNAAAASVPVTAEGETTVNYFATDKAGNIEASRAVVVKIDKTAPSATTATANSTPNSSGYLNGTNGAARVTLGATDATSGISGYYVTATGAQTYTRRFVAASAPVVALADGTTTLTYSALDNAGNEGAATTRTFKVDQTAPVTSYTVSSAGANITLTVNFRDNLSGYAAVTSSVNGEPAQTTTFSRPTTNGSVSYSFNGPYNNTGDYTIKYFGTDVAGNKEAEQSVTFRIPPQAITPFASTPVHNANGTYTVTFGYQNDNQTTFNIAVGSSNFFSPNPQSRNQTTAFQPGRVANAFSVTWNGSTLTWTLKGPDGQTRSVRVR